MTPLYNARGNLYTVASPQTLRDLGLELPASAAQAAATHTAWAAQAVSALCCWPAGQPPVGAKEHRCDGLLVGPFEAGAPFDLLIVNTDGTLAERSGNGLTIFAQALFDQGLATATAPFTLRVHHDKPGSPAPVTAAPAEHAATQGFWLDLGQPTFGPQAVNANPADVQRNGVDAATWRVERLGAVEPQWTQSVFVNLGNPHCVTLLAEAQHLPGFAQLLEPGLHASLATIAFAQGEQGAGVPCPAGINLQWACLVAPGVLEARVFERGEGATASSGTSASAVASAAWRAGWIDAGLVQVCMPGGTAPVRLVEQEGVLQGVALFGTARRVS